MSLPFAIGAIVLALLVGMAFGVFLASLLISVLP